MLTRRGFTGFASCALCAITGFIATEASAQGAPPPSGGVSRRVLSKTDGPAEGYETLLVEADIASIGEKVDLDLFYIENYSLFIDVSLVVKTAVEVLFHQW